ncbi:hypothetical protein SAMN05421869_125165 [Nonomuraea jiangxiensis]|uniref:Uncharacterized protein n=1 Tax=Nonomuraea jiangxiensis TaxID=633440 RepID=A0A1G9JVX0_9ACTN|nr:hypothetical protein SAMN05421869_125165 [Nonomuraea jiangxiensis]
MTRLRPSRPSDIRTLRSLPPAFEGGLLPPNGPQAPMTVAG